MNLLDKVSVYILRNGIDYSEKYKIPIELVEYLDQLKELKTSNKRYSICKCIFNRRSFDLFDYFEAGISRIGDTCMNYSAKNGDLQFLKYCESKGANDWNWALVSASGGGHLPIIKYCEEKGANDWNGALAWALEGCYLNTIENKDDWVLVSASKGYIQVVKYCESKGAIS